MTVVTWASGAAGSRAAGAGRALRFRSRRSAAGGPRGPPAVGAGGAAAGASLGSGAAGGGGPTRMVWPVRWKPSQYRMRPGSLVSGYHPADRMLLHGDRWGGRLDRRHRPRRRRLAPAGGRSRRTGRTRPRRSALVVVRLPLLVPCKRSKCHTTCFVTCPHFLEQFTMSFGDLLPNAARRRGRSPPADGRPWRHCRASSSEAGSPAVC